MLDKEGLPYLYKKNQQVKKSKFYYQFSLNDNDFY